jgi:hypothetical protein
MPRNLEDALVDRLVDFLLTGKLTVPGESLAPVVDILERIVKRGRAFTVRYHHEQKDGGYLQITLEPQRADSAYR